MYVIIICWLVSIGVLFKDIDRVTQIGMLMTVYDMMSFIMCYTLLLCDKNVQDVMSKKLSIFYKTPSSVAVAHVS
ncbi:unnamed protein product [Caenorhabditis angaria]|uniref:Uncharacterized protein n=1 Tax=Caenorhabditis angaria TaxID=860376 RepID=A0A9P1IU02_9PELO|nr:unnamed protein product [Caenorhabditis angaria]